MESQAEALLWCLGWCGATADLTLGFLGTGKIGTCACTCLNRRGLVLNLTPFVGSVFQPLFWMALFLWYRKTPLSLFLNTSQKEVESK